MSPLEILISKGGCYMDFCCYEAGVLRKTEQCHYSCPASMSVTFTPRFSTHQEPIQKIQMRIETTSCRTGICYSVSGLVA